MFSHELLDTLLLFECFFAIQFLSGFAFIPQAHNHLPIEIIADAEKLGELILRKEATYFVVIVICGPGHPKAYLRVALF